MADGVVVSEFPSCYDIMPNFWGIKESPTIIPVATWHIFVQHMRFDRWTGLVTVRAFPSG